MKQIQLIPLITMACTVIGCASTPSVIQNRDKSYLEAKSIPPLRIPPGISSDSFHAAYPVSDRAYPNSAKKVSFVPPGLSSS